MGSADLDQPQLLQLAAQLYRTAVKHGQLDRDYAVSYISPDAACIVAHSKSIFSLNFMRQARLLETVRIRAAQVDSNVSAFHKLASSLT